MKKLFTRPGLMVMVSVLSLGVLFSSCRKNDESQNIQVSAIMAYHLATDRGPAGFSLSGSTLTNSALSYSNYTGFYMTIYPGPRSVEAFDQSGNIASTPYNFEVNKYYSAFFVGANGSYRNVVVDDHIDTLTAPNGVAYVRYVNAVADSSRPVITVTAGGTTIASSTAAFGTVSDFTAVTPGPVVITANNEGTINTTRTITLEAKKVYTVLLQGMPGQTDADKSVQLKFVTNGTITP